jgi:hypothetical protein
MLLVIMNCIACNGINKNAPDSKTEKMLSTESSQTVGDSLTNLLLISQYKTGENDFFKTANEYPASIFLYKNELFLLNYSDSKLIIIDTEKKTTTTNAQINEIIKSNSDAYFGVRQIMTNDKYFFIGFLKAVLCVTKDGLTVSKITSDDNISHFTSTDNSIVIFTADNITRFDIKGQKLASYKTENTLTGHFFNIGNDVYIFDVNQLSIYNTEQLDKSIKVIVSLSSIPFKEPYLACVTLNYTVWYPYMTRDQFFLLDRATNKPVKNIKFNKKNFIPSDKQIELEEGNPNFNLITNDTGISYIITMKNKILEVYRTQ